MSHIRKDAVTKQWVIMSSARSAKPTDYVSKYIEVSDSALSCPFCKGHEDKTPDSFETVYDKNGNWRVRIVPNKYPAVSETLKDEIPKRSLLFESMSAEGYHDVVIEHPEHTFNFYNSTSEDLLYIFRTVIKRLRALSNIPNMQYSLYFKNFGSEAGASLAHSHSQIITTPFIPVQMLEEIHGALDYYITNKNCVYCNVIKEELKINKRIICENEDFIALAPFASKFPYQINIFPKEHHDSIIFSSACDRQFSSIVKGIFDRINNLLGMVSYNYVLHTLSPSLRASYAHVNHWYLDIMPKMSKLAGYELGSGLYINSILPEDAAAELKNSI